MNEYSWTISGENAMPFFQMLNKMAMQKKIYEENMLYTIFLMKFEDKIMDIWTWGDKMCENCTVEEDLMHLISNLEDDIIELQRKIDYLEEQVSILGG